jgi:hypothetical protein
MNRLHRWICRSSFWKKFLQNEMLPWALKDVGLGQNLLEVGPGPGLTTDFLRTRFDRSFRFTGCAVVRSTALAGGLSILLGYRAKVGAWLIAFYSLFR